MGIGALVLSPEIALQPVTFGGGQERGLRPGTIPLPLAVGFGLAAEIAAAERVEEAQRLAGLAMRLRDGLQEIYPEMVLNGDWHARLPGTLNVRFPSIEAEELLLALPNLQLSTGSACGSGRTEPSYVLRAHGLLAEEIAQSIRIGLGRTTTEEDIDTALRDFATALEKLR
jgi:cysteine desulfurase